MSDSTLTKTVIFDAPRQTVWAFLTQKDKLAQWFHPAKADLAKDEDFAFLGIGADGSAETICRGTVLEMNAPEKLVYSFTIKPLGGAMTRVTCTLDECHGGTRLTLVHEGLGEAAGDGAMGMLKAIDAGWDRHFASLRGKAEAG